MLRQIRYFQAVVRNNSFTEAAEECHISQSAISQQVQALERELGFLLLERRNRKFALTPAGEYFYRKSLVLIADFERIRAEAAKISRAGEAALHLGYMRDYGGWEFRRALSLFAAQYPDVALKIEPGNHEELFDGLREGRIDLAFSDQRRAFSDAYVNLVLSTVGSFIEISARSPLAALGSVTLQELKNTPCILVAPPAQQEAERNYCRDVLGFQGDFLFAENLEEARLLVIGGGGFMLAAGADAADDPSVCRIPLLRDGLPVTQTLCAFWKKGRPNPYAEVFANILKTQFY